MNQVLLSDVCEINPRIDLGIGDDAECSFVPMEILDTKEYYVWSDLGEFGD